MTKEKIIQLIHPDLFKSRHCTLIIFCSKLKKKRGLLDDSTTMTRVLFYGYVILLHFYFFKKR